LSTKGEYQEGNLFIYLFIYLFRLFNLNKIFFSKNAIYKMGGGGEGEKQEGKKEPIFFPKLKRHKRHQPFRPIWPFT
jgi:hypothetical protein